MAKLRWRWSRLEAVWVLAAKSRPLKWWAYKFGAELQPKKTRLAPATITLGGVQIRVDYGFDRTLLQEVIAALGGG